MTRDLQGAALVAVRVVVAKSRVMSCHVGAEEKGGVAMPRVADAADAPQISQMAGCKL